MRLISMAQQGGAVSTQRFYEQIATPLPLPVIEGIPPPAHQQAYHHETISTPGGATQGSYAITDEELQRYEGIFKQYDTDHDGFLNGGEAVQLFGMSGLDRAVSVCPCLQGDCS
jgi:hypothetical protein